MTVLEAGGGGGGLTAYEIYVQMHNGPNTGSLDRAQGVSYSESQAEERRAEQIQRIAQKIQAGWQGAAADGAYGAAGPLADAARDAADKQARMQILLDEQSQSFRSAQGNLKPVAENPPESNFLNDITPWETDLDREIKQYQQDSQHNIDIYSRYDSESLSNEQDLPMDYANVTDPGGSVGVTLPGSQPGNPPPGGGQPPVGVAPPGGSPPPGGGVPGPGRGGDGPPAGQPPVPRPGQPPQGTDPQQNVPPVGRPPGTVPPVGPRPPGGAVPPPSGFPPVGPLSPVGPRGSGFGPGSGSGPGGRGGLAAEGGRGLGGGSGSGTAEGGPGARSGLGGRGPGAGGAAGESGAGGRSGLGGGLAEEEAAGRRGAAGRGGAGGLGGMGGGRGHGGDEESEHTRASYLQEADPEAIFGTDQMTAPPVIGE